MSSPATPPTRGLLALALAVLLSSGASAALAADPTADDVRRAEQAVTSKQRDVAAVEADLAAANDRLREVAIRAAQAAEAFNAARHHAQQARHDARVAERQARSAESEVARQQSAYGDALATTYQLSPELTALLAIIDSDGITTVLDRTHTLRNAETAMNDQWDRFRATSTLAEVASAHATEARAAADAAQDEARAARDSAAAAEADAAHLAEQVTATKTALIVELADLKDISVATAEAYQSALEEQQAQEAADQAAEDEADEAAPTDGPSDEPTSEPTSEATDGPSDGPSDEPSDEPTQEPTQEPEEPTEDAPSVSGGASDALAFAADQIGEPYRWGAAGPNAWDCSGLTMKAWAAGGISLPHYSVGQYDAATPIKATDLRPGDLVFWGSSSSASSIYHVALYVGDGQIIHAPRTGRDVTRESMYYWIPPTFFARP